MMGLSIDCLLKDTPEDPVPTTAPSGTPAPEDQPNPAPASALRKHWLTILLILLRQYLLEGSNTELIPTSEITLTFTLDSFVFYEPLFLAYTETVLP